MARTPEAAVKARVRSVLQRYKGIYVEMPVPSGYGNTTLDFICCYRGRFFAIETKAGKKKPTAKQDIVMQRIRAAGGKTFVINDDLLTVIALVTWLNSVEPTNDPDIASE